MQHSVYAVGLVGPSDLKGNSHCSKSRNIFIFIEMYFHIAVMHSYKVVTTKCKIQHAVHISTLFTLPSKSELFAHICDLDLLFFA